LWSRPAKASNYLKKQLKQKGLGVWLKW
jgi:hypothetical protein